MRILAIKLDGLAHRFIQVDDPGCSIDHLEIECTCDELVWFERNPKCLFNAGEICKMQTVGFFGWPGWRDFDALLEQCRPRLEIIDASSRANDADPDFPRFLCLSVRPV